MTRYKDLDRSKASLYLQRAEEFYRSMQILSHQDLKAILELADLSDYYHQNQYFHAAVLLGIHATIAMVDAILVTILGRKSQGESHSEAKRLLEQACKTAQVDDLKKIAGAFSLLQRGV